MDDDKQRWTCVDCGTLSPETETPKTLISAQHGWRVVFVLEDGKQSPQWRCASCWHDYRARRERDH